MKYFPLALIISGIAFAILTRVVLPFEHVFTPGGIQLNTPDAYIMIRYADMFPNGISWDWYSNWPDGQSAFHYTTFSFIVWTTARILNISTMAAGAILPPLLFLTALLPVYLTARVLFDKYIATVSVFTLCLLPGEILHRTMLGAADYHCWEILLVCTYFACLIYAIRTKSLFMVIAASVVFAVYFLSWQGAIIILPVLLVACVVALFLQSGYNERIVITIGAMAFTGLCIRFIPDMSPMHWHGFLQLFTINLAQPVTEMQSFLFTSGQFDMSVMIRYFGLTFWIALAGIGWMAYRIYRHKDTADIVFLAWTCTTLAMMICMRRFDYYFAVNGAILTAFIVVRIIRYTGRNQAVRIAVVALFILCLPLVKQSVMTGLSDTGYMPAGWQQATAWLRSQANESRYYSGLRPDHAVMSWWNNGYWITGAGHHAVLCDNGNQDTDGRAAKLLMADYEWSRLALRNMQVKYVLIDDQMMTSSLYPIMHKAGSSNPAQSFMFRLYSMPPDRQFENVKLYVIY